MGTIKAQDIFGKVQTILQDTTGIRWPEPELIGWINSAERQIVMLKPDSMTETNTLTLVPGSKQSISTDALLLLDCIRNMGEDGETPGRAITPVSRAVLDNSLPNWHVVEESATQGEIKHYCYDVKNPKTFWVYPPVVAAEWYVECAESVVPTEIDDGNDTISLDDIYEESIINYMLFRAYSKDAEYSGNHARAAAAYELFLGTLGLKGKVDVAMAPVMAFGAPDGPETE